MYKGMSIQKQEILAGQGLRSSGRWALVDQVNGLAWWFNVIYGASRKGRLKGALC